MDTVVAWLPSEKMVKDERGSMTADFFFQWQAVKSKKI
jgi:hypothetical protein